MRTKAIHRAAALALTAAVLLGGSAQALFGKKQPAAPAAEGAPAAQDVEVRTYRGIRVEGQLLAASPSGEDLIFSLEKAPRKGSVTITGADFAYTPDDGATGADSFTYTATDASGRVSPPATVTVSIEKTKSGVTYADMGGSAAAAAAQHLAEEGIFTGTRIGGQYYFQPTAAVTRSEFLAMAMETACRPVTAVTVTGFCDDDAIPTWAKAYAAAAVADGVIQGRTTAEGAAFSAAKPITFNEAATVLNRVLARGDVEVDEWYAGREAAPSWAAQAVGNMEALSVLPAGSFGNAALDSPITRADAAKMLSAAKTLLDGEDEEGMFRFLK